VLVKGQAAPYPGYLFPEERIVRLLERADQCEDHAKLAGQLAEDTAAIRARECAAKLALATEGGKAREKLLLEALDAAKADAQREWWEQPAVTLPAGITLGLVVGIGATVGAVLLVGQLRP
jgi:hypothetical protein